MGEIITLFPRKNLGEFNPEYHFKRGLELMDTDLVNARNAFVQAESLGHPADQVLVNLAIIERKLGRTHAAEKFLRDALKKNPKSINAWYNLGYMIMNSNPEEARDCFLTALSIVPSDESYGNILFNLHLVYLRLDQKTEALRYLISAREVYRRKGLEAEEKGCTLYINRLQRRGGVLHVV